jgi:glucose dehydrogenase
MINVGRIVNSRNFAQPGGFTVYRQTGQWDAGDWTVSSETTIQMQGTVTAMNPKDLTQVPEGDRVTGIMCFYSQQPIYVTRATDGTSPGGTSDEIVWQGERYRVSSVNPWQDFGYYKAFGVRMVSD